MYLKFLAKLLPFSFSGRGEEQIKYIEEYLKANKMFRDYNNPDEDPVFTEVCLDWFNCSVFYVVFDFKVSMVWC